ncbi:MAG TPA: hypothetical protein VNE40_04565 [Candidatus Dormibacteraeota bacterium]|nr:hypothetical protein [Candidatus Dormibacteraeota bacterium]
MIQLNLLPDVKLEYIKAQRLRRLLTSVSVLVSTVALVALVLLFLFVDVVQKKNLGDLNRDIHRYSSQLQNTKDLNKILTVQNQLSSLTQLHNQKPAASQLFGYLNQTTPANADINNFAIDFNQHSITITGTADALSTVNQYVDTLKFTTYTTGTSSGNNSSSTKAFSGVVLSSFGRSDKGASYTINLSYDPNIFDITQTIKLVVPQQVTTRSEVDQPAALFRQPVPLPTNGTTGN